MIKNLKMNTLKIPQTIKISSMKNIKNKKIVLIKTQLEKKCSNNINKLYKNIKDYQKYFVIKIYCSKILTNTVNI